MSAPTPHPAAGAHRVPAPGPGPDAARPDVADVAVGDLVGNVTRDLSTLMRQELALARAELTQEASTAGKAAGALGAAGVAGHFALLFASLALWAGLANLMDPGWAALIVTVVWAAVAAALYVGGRARLRRVRPTPERTIDSLSRIPEAVKGHRGGTR